MLRCLRIFCYALAGLLALSLSGAWGRLVTPVKAAPLEQAAEPNGPNTIFMPLIATPTPYAIYRSGQTFLSWPERWDLQGELYTIYRSSQPITADNWKSAAQLYSVGKNSANFYANRYCTLPGACGNPPNANWRPRYIDRYMIQDGGEQIPGNWGLLVWTLAAEDFSNRTAGDGYYTITVTPAGGTETYNQGSSIGPIAEAVADPRPVEMTSPGGINIGAGGHAYIQFMDLRSWNPTFHAPNPTNQYYGLDPADPSFPADLQYAYDYDVFTPTASMCGGSLPKTLPVFVWLHGHRDNTKSGEVGYPDHLCAYGIYPFDDTDTWYFGFASWPGWDYRNQQGYPNSGSITNYTEQRVLRMIYDLEKNPPGQAVDVQRIYVAGQSMGGTGSLAFAERYPNVFAAAYASQPVTNFRTAQPAAYGQNWQDDASIKWGTPDLNLPVSISAPNGWADGIQNLAKTLGVWDWEDLQARAADTRLKEMAVIGVSHGTSDTVVWYDTQGAPTYSDLDAGKRPWSGVVNGARHEWQYYLGLPPGAAKNSSGVPFWGLSVKRDETVPGFSNLSGNRNVSDGQTGIYNQTINWSSSWNPWDGVPTDTASKWQMSFCAVQNGSTLCGTGRDQTVDITLRRLQNFKIYANKTYKWENLALNNSPIQSGTFVAASDGQVITIQGVKILNNGSRLVVTPS